MKALIGSLQLLTYTILKAFVVNTRHIFTANIMNFTENMYKLTVGCL